VKNRVPPRAGRAPATNSLPPGRRRSYAGTATGIMNGGLCTGRNSKSRRRRWPGWWRPWRCSNLTRSFLRIGACCAEAGRRSVAMDRESAEHAAFSGSAVASEMAEQRGSNSALRRVANASETAHTFCVCHGITTGQPARTEMARRRYGASHGWVHANEAKGGETIGVPLDCQSNDAMT
jgi:hypothetical protein